MAINAQYGLTPADSSEPSSANADNPYGLQPVTSTVDPTYGLAPAPPQADPAARFSFGTGDVSVYRPSVWDRIKSAVTAGIPIFHGSRFTNIHDPKYGQMQLIAPEEAMSPSEQERHPILTGIGEVAGGLTSPVNTALIAGTAGLGELPGAAAMLPRLMSAGFGAQSIYQAAKTYPEIRAAFARGDASEAERLLTHAVVDLGMAALATRHAATGKALLVARRGRLQLKARSPHQFKPFLQSQPHHWVKCWPSLRRPCAS